MLENPKRQQISSTVGGNQIVLITDKCPTNEVEKDQEAGSTTFYRTLTYLPRCSLRVPCCG